LLRQGAILTERADDVIGEIAPHLRKRRPAAPVLAGDDARVYASIGEESTDIDRIVATVGLPIHATLDILMRLELGGLILQLPGKSFVRAAIERPAH
jgi:predicted Rossmann fold nucleotide-binding protein DprA/Smf involved in DNA uptake